MQCIVGSFLILAGAAFLVVNSGPVNEGPYKLCTYDKDAQGKCEELLVSALASDINLPLECVERESREACAKSVATGDTDWMVATGHGYMVARKEGIVPVIFETVSNESLYIAVAPRGTTLQQVATMPVELDIDNHRAFHAAAFFNLRRGHDICPHLRHSHSNDTIMIVDSSQYKPKPNDILICPDHSLAEFADYKKCNFEAELQRAVFVAPSKSSTDLVTQLRSLLNTIMEHFSAGSAFNFFGAFNGQDDVIFRNDAVAFDLEPTYLNGVNVDVFNDLHCNSDDHEHHPSHLE